MTTMLLVASPRAVSEFWEDYGRANNRNDSPRGYPYAGFGSLNNSIHHENATSLGTNDGLINVCPYFALILQQLFVSSRPRYKVS